MQILSSAQYFEPELPPVQVMTIPNHSPNRQHGHEFYEMVFIVRGSALHSTGGSTSILTAGDIFLLPPGQSHNYISTHNTHLYNCLFLPAALEGVAALRVPPLPEEIVRGATRTRADLLQRQELVLILERIRWEFGTRSGGWKRMVMSKFWELLVQYERIYSTRPYADSAGAHYRQLMKALAHIEAHAAENITLEELAAASGLSASHLTRQFKAAAGMAPMEYCRSFRMALAAEALKDPGKTVAAVARELGFSDVSVFSRQFKLVTGMSPSEFRRSV